MIMRYSVACDKPVDAEAVIITAVRDLAEVTAGGIPIFLKIVVEQHYRLVNKIPDAATLKLRIFLKHLHVVLQSAAAVTHGMAVFDHDERSV